MKYYKILACTLAVLSFSNCSNENNIVISQQPPVQKTLDGLSGLWEGVDNDTTFIAITKGGEVVYYASRDVMGRGSGKIDKDTIVIYNGYTGTKDFFYIDEETGTRLSVTWKIGSKIHPNTYKISKKTYRKTNETVVTSFAGDMWLFGWNTIDPYFKEGLTQKRLLFTSDNTCITNYYNSKYGERTGDAFFYIPRLYKNKTKLAFTHSTKSINDIVWIVKYNK